jgi:tetratricopeptide (TPR) repeat protein
MPKDNKQRGFAILIFLALLIIAGVFLFTRSQLETAQQVLMEATNHYGTALAREENALAFVATATREYASLQAAQSTALAMQETASVDLAVASSLLGTSEAAIATANAREVLAVTELSDANTSLTNANATLSALNQGIEDAETTQRELGEQEAIALVFVDSLIGDINASDIDELDKFIEANPDSALAYYARGLVYDEIEQYESAISDYSHAFIASSRIMMQRWRT